MIRRTCLLDAIDTVTFENHNETGLVFVLSSSLKLLVLKCQKLCQAVNITIAYFVEISSKRYVFSENS